MNNLNTNAPRPRSTRPRTAVEAGLPDPRPVTDYTVAMTTVGGNSRLTVTLAQPCVVRQPAWPLVDCADGSLVHPSSVTVLSNTSFRQDYAGLVSPSVALVAVPYQDTNVQNFSGGFVAPGGRWFRQPVMPPG